MSSSQHVSFRAGCKHTLMRNSPQVKPLYMLYLYHLVHHRHQTTQKQDLCSVEIIRQKTTKRLGGEWLSWWAWVCVSPFHTHDKETPTFPHAPVSPEILRVHQAESPWPGRTTPRAEGASRLGGVAWTTGGRQPSAWGCQAVRLATS